MSYRIQRYTSQGKVKTLLTLIPLRQLPLPLIN
jgi:hypothetical protein